MLNNKFYWGTIRKAIVAFGNVFNNIFIDRRDSNGDVAQTIRVPLSYAPRHKFLAITATLPDSEITKTQVTLPRMAFEMTRIAYDGDRKISLVRKNCNQISGSNARNSQYSPVPYDVDISLYLYSKNQDDALQVVEQILPYFNPDLNVTVNAIPALELTNDIPIILNNIDYQDDYEGDFTDRRSIFWTFNFTLKLNLFGPLSTEGVIKSVNARVFNNPDMTGNIFNYNAVVDPFTANSNDKYDVIETFNEFIEF